MALLDCTALMPLRNYDWMSIVDREIAKGIQRLHKQETFEYDVSDAVRAGIRMCVESAQLSDDPIYHQAFRNGFEVAFHGYVIKLMHLYDDYDFITINGDRHSSCIVLIAHKEYFANLNPNGKEMMRLIREENMTIYEARQIAYKGLKPGDTDYAVNNKLALIRSR